MPSPSFKESASLLDNRRLGKQRVETLQIMTTLARGDGPWSHHPAVNMWRGYESALLLYQEAVCVEWHIFRGFEDTCLRKTIDVFYKVPWFMDNRDIRPWWIDDDEFHISHMSNLKRKDPEWYGPLFPRDLPTTLDYIWPL